MAPGRPVEHYKEEERNIAVDKAFEDVDRNEKECLLSPREVNCREYGQLYINDKSNGDTGPYLSDLRKCSEDIGLQKQYPFFFSKVDSENCFTEHDTTISLSSQDLGNSNSTNEKVMLDFSQSLPHVISFDRKATNFLTSMNVFCLIQGVSIFALPFVTVKSFIPVVSLTLFLGFVNWYTAYLLVECQHQISESRPGIRKRVYPTFIDIGRAAFHAQGELVMKVITVTIVVSGISYFILLGQVTFDAVHSILPLTTQHWIVVWALILLPSLFINRVSVMCWFSMTSTMSLTLVVFIISGVLITNLKHWETADLQWGIDVEYFFLAYGVIQNSFFVHLVVPAIEGSMKRPENCHEVMASSFAVNTAFKLVFQSMAAVTFGSATEQSVTSNITSPLSVAFLINVLTVVNLYCGFPIIFCVLFEMLDTYLLPSFKVFDPQKKACLWAWRILSRLLTLVFVVFVSVSIPQFGLVVSFLGNLRSTVAAMILPLCFYIKLRWRNASKVNKGLVVTLLLVSTSMGLAAAYFSGRGIVYSLQG